MARNAKSPTPESVRAVIEPVVTAAGLFFEDVRVSGPPNRLVVRVVIDLPDDEIGGLDLDRIAQVSRPISDALDASEVLTGAYNLEVSSPGASRPLTAPRHFKRARTRLVRLGLVDGGSVAGRIASATDDVVVLEDESGAQRSVPLSDVRSGVVEVELRRMSEAELGPVDDDGEQEG